MNEKVCGTSKIDCKLEKGVSGGFETSSGKKWRLGG